MAEAENLQRDALDIERRAWGPENPGILYDLETEAIYLSLGGRYSSAEELFRQAIEIAGKTKEPIELAHAWYALPAERLLQDAIMRLLDI